MKEGRKEDEGRKGEEGRQMKEGRKMPEGRKADEGRKEDERRKKQRRKEDEGCGKRQVAHVVDIRTTHLPPLPTSCNLRPFAADFTRHRLHTS
jgi:hypothetical protein